MYLVSRYGGRGPRYMDKYRQWHRNVRDRQKRQVNVKVRNGIAIEETTRTGNQCTILRYGQDLTIKKGKRSSIRSFTTPSTLRGMKKGGLWKRQRDFPLCGTKGTLECFSTSSGSCGKEIFTYGNGGVGIYATRWRKKLVVYRPSGKLWMVVKGKTHVSRYPIAAQLEKNDGDFDIWRFMDGRDWDLTVYDTDGTTVVTQGHFNDRQKEGKWLEEQQGEVLHRRCKGQPIHYRG